MRRPWHPSQDVLHWLVLLAAILIVALGIKEHWFLVTNIGQYKDGVTVITSIFGSAFLLIGGLLSYIRFFKGRTLHAKLNIMPRVGVIAINESENLHWIDIEIENRGSVAVWRENLAIYATLHGDSPYCVRVDDCMPLITEHGQDVFIDVAETAHEHAFLKVPGVVYAVTYHIVFTDIRAYTWVTFITSDNKKDN